MITRRIAALTLVAAIVAGIFGYRHARYQRGIKHLNHAISAAAGLADPTPLRETDEDHRLPSEEEIRKTQELHSKWANEMVSELKKAYATLSLTQFEQGTLQLIAERKDAGACMNIGMLFSDEERFQNPPLLELALKTFDVCLLIIADRSATFRINEELVGRKSRSVPLLYEATLTALRAGQMDRARKYKAELKKLCYFTATDVGCSFWPATTNEEMRKLDSIN